MRKIIGKLIGKMKIASHFMDFCRLITDTMKAPRGKYSSTLDTRRR
jgi:hypothetical protein